MLLLATAFSYTVSAQFVIATDVTALPLSAKGLEKSATNPFLYNETLKGNIVLADRTSQNDLTLLYDIISDNPVIVDAKGSFLMLNQKPLQFEMNIPQKGTQVYKRGFPAINKYDEGSFYEVLVEGKVQLLKKAKKSFTESIPYGTVNVVKKALITDTYYLYDGTQLKKINKDPKALINAFGDQKTILNKYLAELKEKSTSNEDLMIALIGKYNAMN